MELHQLPIAVQIGGYTFSHGTINKDYAKLGVHGINEQRIQSWIKFLQNGEI